MNKAHTPYYMAYKYGPPLFIHIINTTAQTNQSYQWPQMQGEGVVLEEGVALNLPSHGQGHLDLIAMTHLWNAFLLSTAMSSLMAKS